jgi:hypothetical protein
LLISICFRESPSWMPHHSLVLAGAVMDLQLLSRNPKRPAQVSCGGVPAGAAGQSPYSIWIARRWIKCAANHQR